MRSAFSLLLSSILLLGCSSTRQIAKRYTADDQTVFALLERLKKDAGDKDAAALLPEAYRQAADVRKAMNSNTYNNMNAGDRWMEIAGQLEVAAQMYSQIKAIPAAAKIIPNPWNPTLKMQEAKQKAAEEYYNQGQHYLSYNNRAYGQKAYEMFVKAGNAYPRYRDVEDRIREAQEMATVKVVVRPVNYYNNNWRYWGFDNDYLQYAMVRDLNNASYNNTRFYSDREAEASFIKADRVVELNFNDLYIGSIYTDRYTIQRSKKIEIGQTRSVPAKPVYKTVTATVHVTRSILQSRASLDCRIYDWVSGRNILADRFRDNYTWQHEAARYTGDRQALEASDWNLINSSGAERPPSREELAARLVDNCYNQLLSRIRSGVSF
ncbi:hypothetical protein [Agriterribacter sp.]|uniref:hypothetical protein n=1 Tax=Agriterribacter sp. TaxID=2821509 RepID=UPI002BDBE991|nr:hypothetical protein [Agriterribacter sp.]HRO45379.1 hypothetical protein [Agriterribacter sp.]HRQ16929.1 hypothetical protein [Agriterribacter sp.]